MFDIDVPVVHPRHGAGRISGTQMITREGKTIRYYCIELTDNRGTVMIPSEHIDEVGLREASVDFGLIRRIMGNEPNELSSDYRVRQSYIRDQIKSGDPLQIIQALRDLCWHEKQSRLNTVDSQLKERAKELITHELSLKPQTNLDTARVELNSIIKIAIEHHQLEQ